jgi:hypothetical protein
MKNYESKINLEDRINCVLVLGGIRTAYYIQYNGENAIGFHNRIKNLEKFFPELFFQNFGHHVLITPSPVSNPDNDMV